MKCPRCKGEGSVEETVNAGDGMSPDRDVPVICHICEGKGEVPEDFFDEEDFEEDYFIGEQIDEFYFDHPDYLKAEDARHNKK